MRTTTRVSGSSSRIARVASIPSITGIAMSIRTTSGAVLARQLDRGPAVARRARRPSIRPSVERIASSASAKRRWSSAITTRTLCAPSRQYRIAEWTTAEARQKIHDLLLTGDNRLKQGVSAEKIRQSYEQALAVAREHGLEESVRPLVEIRLADLERLAGGSPPPAPPDA